MNEIKERRDEEVFKKEEWKLHSTIVHTVGLTLHDDL